MLPEYQGLGIGSKVLKLIEERFPSVKVWTLDTMQQSPRNHHFYEKNGYKLSSEDEEERYYCKVIDESTLSNSIFGDSNMSKVEICHSSLSEAYIHDINLDVDKDKSHIVMERCELTNSKIIDSNLQNVKLENCNIDGMTINGVKVTDMLECYKKYI